MSSYIKREWPILLILIMTFAVATMVYPSMPDRIPIHWNVSGEVDNYGSKVFGTFFLPVLNLVMYIFLLITPMIDPKRANYAKFSSSYLVIRYSLHVFFALMFGLVIAASLGYPVNIGKWVAIGVAVLFIVMGNLMGRIRYNYLVGFRFPWTLANENVWKKTHQVGAKAMVLGGILSLIGVIFTSGMASFIILMAGIFIPVIIIMIYSYLLHKKQK